jgi:sphinganine-1-phosphate aldolase
MALPAAGRSRDDVLADLAAMRTKDVRWREGYSFTLAYFAGDEVHDLAKHVFGEWMSENALNTDAFPSLRKIQTEVVGVVTDWLEGGEEAAGFMTTGGTESILMAVKAARERGKAERGITQPNVVLPASAHAAFEKGCYYFGLESRRIPVRSDWRADVDAMAAAIDENTVLIVGSAPQYPQGVIDPIPEIAGLAAERGINCHVDACMGGVTLTYLKRLGHDVPPWNFSVPGVTSISVDLHKFGYTAKGASVIAHRNKQLRRYQTFLTDNWLGGFYGSSGVLGTKSGSSMAAAWAVLHHLGDEGYLRLTAAARKACDELAAGIKATPELQLWADPEATLISFGATDPTTLNMFAVADSLWKRGWFLDRQGPPDSLHCTVNAVHEHRIADFLVALRKSIDEVVAANAGGEKGAYGTVE